jgi:hypothetical protein
MYVSKYLDSRDKFEPNSGLAFLLSLSETSLFVLKNFVSNTKSDTELVYIKIRVVWDATPFRLDQSKRLTHPRKLQHA